MTTDPEANMTKEERWNLFPNGMPYEAYELILEIVWKSGDMIPIPILRCYRLCMSRLARIVISGLAM